MIAQCVVTDFICAQIQLNHWIDLKKTSIDFVYQIITFGLVTRVLDGRRRHSTGNGNGMMI